MQAVNNVSSSSSSASCSNFEDIVALTYDNKLLFSSVDNSIKLRMYGLYKCYINRSGPSGSKPLWDVVGRKKWTAWDEAYDEVRGKKR